MKNVQNHVRFSVKKEHLAAKSNEAGAYQPMIVLPRLLKKLYGYGVYHRERSGAF